MDFMWLWADVTLWYILLFTAASKSYATNENQLLIDFERNEDKQYSLIVVVIIILIIENKAKSQWLDDERENCHST